jgi:hypothetical protein
MMRRDCTETGKHVLLRCYDCEDQGWCQGDSCPGNGYFECCMFCGEPMGNERRKWKRRNAENNDTAEVGA